MTNLPVHVVGLGSTGSHVAYAIAKTYAHVCGKLHVWDPDFVSRENCRNQAYDTSLVSRRKTDAVAQLFSHLDTGIRVSGCSASVFDTERLSGVVFLCADMHAHKDIVKSATRPCSVDLFIETRIEATGALVHVFDPRNKQHVKEWMRWWYPDNPAVAPHGCGAATGEMPIGILTASLAVSQLMRYAAMRDGMDDVLDNQIRIYMRPLRVETYQW